MSNLKSAKNALQAELKHARQGLAFYQSRVEALEQSIASLSSIDGAEAMRGKAMRGKGAAPEDAKASKPARRTRESKTSLPATGKEFWSGLLGAEPQSSKEILGAAVKALGISPSRDDLKKLAQRQANALHMLVKAKAISDSGTGRDRRYSR